MVDAAQIPLLTAAQVAQEAHVQQAPNGIFYTSFGETNVSAEDLERIVQAVPAVVAGALTRRAWYFVPLAIGEDDETTIAPAYNIDLGDRAICHRNVSFGSSDFTFISTRLMQDSFALAFEYFINVAHQFVEAVGVPESFSDLTWSQVKADVRGETSQDAWESRRRTRERSQDRGRPHESTGPELVLEAAGHKNEHVDEKARTAYFQAAFSDALAIYMLALTLDFDYTDLREREYPLLAAPALAERLRHVASLFPANPGYEFEIRYRRRG